MRCITTVCGKWQATAAPLGCICSAGSSVRQMRGTGMAPCAAADEPSFARIAAPRCVLPESDAAPAVAAMACARKQRG